MSLRPRRSVLYMPGSNRRALEKARSLAADCVVMDLEDAVAPVAKAEAREQAAAMAQAGGYRPRELIIRINSLNSDWGRADLQAVATAGIDAVCLPKVEDPAEILATVEALDKLGAPTSLAIWAMIETPRGVMHIEAIADSHPRLAVLVMGTTDLAKELRIPHTPDRIGLQYALSRCVMAARASGQDILDGVYLELDDADGLRAVCEQGRDLGFDGKTLIHPGQIAAANSAFGPSPADLERDQRILTAWQEAQDRGEGVAVVDGKLVEAMHIDEARRRQAIARGIAELEGQS